MYLKTEYVLLRWPALWEGYRLTFFFLFKSNPSFSLQCTHVSMSKHLFCTSDRVHMGELERQILAHGSVHKRDCYHEGSLKLPLANAWISVL